MIIHRGINWTKLALAVLLRVKEDLRGKGTRPHAALHFLTRREDVAFWCGLAGVDPQVFVEQMRKGAQDV